MEAVDGVGATNVTMTEDIVGRGPGREAAGGEAGLSETLVPNGGPWLVEDASSSVLAPAGGDSFGFPSGPGGPLLFPPRPGAFEFAGGPVGL